MRYLSLIVVFLFMLSCSPTDPAVSPTTDPTASINAIDVNLPALDADAVEYYKDIAVLGEWYADHPTVLQAELSRNERVPFTDSTYNDLVGKLSALRLYDENGKLISFFKLDENARHAFLKDYIKVESKFLDDKFKLAATEQIDDHIEGVNAAVDQTMNTAPYTENFNFDAEAAKITSSNPYQKINQALQQRLGSTAPQPGQSYGTPNDEQSFFKLLADSKLLSFSPTTFNPICTNNTPQNFVDKMRSKLRRGLVLVSLPGGFITGTPLAFNGTKFDVGHVAIVSKDASEIPATVNLAYQFSIGTDRSHGMHNERVDSTWTLKHGMTYLMKPVRVSYNYKPKGSIIPWWERTEQDVDNTKTYQKITETLRRPYCEWYEMTTAKLTAPDRFICSSSAWWAIKAAHDIGIGDFYKPTIFPAGVYESSDMRVVAQSW